MHLGKFNTHYLSTSLPLSLSLSLSLSLCVIYVYIAGYSLSLVTLIIYVMLFKVIFYQNISLSFCKLPSLSLSYIVIKKTNASKICSIFTKYLIIWVCNNSKIQNRNQILFIPVENFIKVTSPDQKEFLKNESNPNTVIPPSKALIGESIKDILKIRTVTSLQCRQFC